MTDGPDRIAAQPMLVADARAAAQQAFDWIGSVAREVEGGLGWLEGEVAYDDVYSGTAGVLLAAAEVAGTGIDTAAIARGARLRLLYLAERAVVPDLVPDDGLFTGWAGVAVALRAWSDVSDDRTGAAAATEVIAHIATRMLGASSAGCTDIISGHAGILLALLGGRSGRALDAAQVLADRLVAVAEPAPGGRQWRMEPGYERIMPGFSHGTAGVAYALLCAGRVLDRPDLIEVAVQGAEALLIAGNTPRGWALPLTVPRQPNRPEVSFGWCHGPTGTVRLLVLLDELEPQARWAHAVDLCLAALRESRLPQRLYPGYWDNLGRCCGTAGVGQLLLDRYSATGSPALLVWADTLAADVIARVVRTPAGVSWSNTEHTMSPPELAPEPGFMQGVAGIAAWLGRLAVAHDRAGVDLLPARVTPTWV